MHTTPNLFSELLRTVNPTWYFTLETAVPVFADVSKLPKEVQNLVDMQVQYSDPVMQKADAAYQLLKKGWVDITPENAWNPELVPVKPVDRYTFLRRFYKKQWVWYLLLRRLMALHNPVIELVAFVKSFHVKYVDLYSNPFIISDHFSLNNSVPKPIGVSVIIPTLNRYRFLKDVLNDLARQSYPIFEVIVVDQSDPFSDSVYQGYKFPLKVIQQEEKKLWYARNQAILDSKYDLLLFFDDDSRVETDWIEKHIKALHYFEADISAGVSLSKVGQKIPENYGYFRYADQFDSGNAMVKKSVFHSTGLFDEQFEKMRMGDGEFGLRAYLKGARSISNPLAKRVHLKVGEGGLRQMGSWDGFRPKKWFSPRPIPSVIYLYRRYYPVKNVWEGIFLGVVMSLNSYKYKSNKAMTLLSMMVSVLLFPLILFQVWRSWKIAGLMLSQGPSIQSLHEV